MSGAKNPKRSGAPALRAALIRTWKPWERSTGPKSAEGQGSRVAERIPREPARC